MYHEEPNWERIEATVQFEPNTEPPFIHVTLKDKK
jgi:hypothetical protein